ncbi:MAG: hypothetical protein ACOYBQ_06530 [Fluviibacter sp.]
MRSMIWVLWPSFVAAAIAEFVFFAVADPQQLYWMGERVKFSVSTTYSIGFLFFWMICAGSSVLTFLLLPPRIRSVLAMKPEMPELDDYPTSN